MFLAKALLGQSYDFSQFKAQEYDGNSPISPILVSGIGLEIPPIVEVQSKLRQNNNYCSCAN